MNLARISGRWPIYLGLVGLLVVGASVWYTNRLANELSVIEENYIEMYELAMNDILNDPIGTTSAPDPGSPTLSSDLETQALNVDYSTQTFIIQNNTTIPAILVDEYGEIVDAVNFGDRSVDTDSAYLSEQLQELIAAGAEPKPAPYGVMYFGSSRLLRQLRFFPVIQGGLILAFVAVGILGIIQARKAEQNRVWVGMAKETAHQLGTPISGIMGWVEHLKLMYAEDAELLEVSEEMSKDVGRLELVANRFSKIGAEPELEPVGVYGELRKVADYMAKRAPRRVDFDFPEPATGQDPRAAVNPLLFDWVIENLLRNALDALDGRGTVSGRVSTAGDRVRIDISDTGKGIASRNIRKVFNPGFTTKKRGWGLGLSLVKRIVEEYHDGRIVVSKSEVGKGTTFTITLPRVVE